MKLKRGPQAIFLSLLVVACTAVPAMRRDLGGVIGGLLDPDVHSPSITPMPNTAKQTHAVLTTTSTSSLAGETTKGHATTRTAESTSMEATVTSSTLDTTTAMTEANGSSTPTSSWPTKTSNNMDHIAQDASHMSPEEATEWKVIGITVLGITVIGSIMLAALFSDTWIKLVKDVILGGNMKQKKDGDEELVPDWKRRSWEYMLADEEGHRYPTVSVSLQSLAEKAEKGTGSQATQTMTTTTTLDAATPMVPPPAPSYIPELDPHPMEPLFRRPSLKYQR
ncbi:hypothetical protein JOM56_006623 [Amanita muscaria]